jgi:hypothetical protein
LLGLDSDPPLGSGDFSGEVMEVEKLISARRTAEAAVQDMADGPLRTTAFATILAQLLQEQLPTNRVASLAAPAGRPSASRRKGAGQRRDGTTSRLLNLVDEGFFNQQRSLSEIRSALAERGWHYQVEALGTPVTRLVRSKHKYLRRTKVAEGGKKLWKYSKY